MRKAASVLSGDTVGNWLYGVAYRTALKARSMGARKGAREKQVTIMPEPAQKQSEHEDELHAMLDRELSRLPDKYRAVIVLCDLEGKTRKEAARHCKLLEGTVASRLATARAMLARRLRRPGMALSGGALAMLLAQTASATMPAAVAAGTIRAAHLFAVGQVAATGTISARAVALAEGVLKTMLLGKLKIATVVLVVLGALGTGTAALTRQAPAQAPPQPAVKKELAAQPASEKKVDPALPQVVSGVIKSVDAATNTLTITHRDGATTCKVASDAHIDIDGKSGALAGLPVGANVILCQFAEDRSCRSLQASGASVFAAVKSVDTDKNSITVSGGPADGKTFRVTPDTQITIDGKQGKLAGIPAGATLHALTLCVDQQTVRGINAEGPGLHHVEVKAVDLAKNTITFDDKGPADVAGKTLAVAPDADVRIDGQPGKLSGLPAGAFVNVGLTVDRRAVHRLDAQGAHLGECGGSMVKAVDARSGFLTFDDKAHPSVAGKTYRVAPDANVLIDGKPGKLSDLSAGAYVNLILSVDLSTARHVHAQGPPAPCDCGGSMVKTVDVEKGTITFDDKARAEVAGKTYPVARDANIVIDGKSGTLAGLPAGAFVSLRLRINGQTAGQVFAQGRSVAGVVKAVDAAKATVTVDDTTFPIAGDAIIVVRGQKGQLAELPTGASVTLTLHVDQKTVGMIHHAKTP